MWTAVKVMHCSKECSNCVKWCFLFDTLDLLYRITKGVFLKIAVVSLWFRVNVLFKDFALWCDLSAVYPLYPSSVERIAMSEALSSNSSSVPHTRLSHWNWQNLILSIRVFGWKLLALKNVFLSVALWWIVWCKSPSSVLVIFTSRKLIYFFSAVFQIRF